MYLGGYHLHHRPRHHEERNMEYGIWNEEPLTDFVNIRTCTLVVWNDDRRANLARRCMCMVGVV